MDVHARERLWLGRIRDVCRLLASETKPEELFRRILDAALEVTRARRGFLVLAQGRKPGGGFRIKVVEARGFDQEGLSGRAGEVSRTVVKTVLERGAGLVSTRADDAHVLLVSSVQGRQVLSIVSVPLKLRGEIRGVLYLDDDRGGVFSESDIPVLETFADQAALALESVELSQADPQHAARQFSSRGFGSLIGKSAPMLELYEQTERVARSWDHVLITGESGTGKELVAREIHERGSSHGEPFLSENCAAIADTLLDSELFGHEKGAFTGAVQAYQGLFREAGRGTLFLDEVGDMSLAMQAKLLRVLQERRVRPVGGRTTLPISCRVIAATHKDLRQLVVEGAFREDLYYRLDVLRLTLPPLRDRPDDIPALIDHFVSRLPSSFSLTPRALELMQSWSWPGNVRELENEIRRLSILGQKSVSAQSLSECIRTGRGLASANTSLGGKTLGDVEKTMVEAALRSCQGNKARAARQLGVPRTTLYRLIERYDLGT